MPSFPSKTSRGVVVRAFKAPTGKYTPGGYRQVAERCNTCNKSFYDIKGLMKHLNTAEAHIRKSVDGGKTAQQLHERCNRCDKDFRDPNGLANHINTAAVHSGRVLENNAKPSQATLDRAGRRMHSANERRKVQLPKACTNKGCTESFVDDEARREHEVDVHGRTGSTSPQPIPTLRVWAPTDTATVTGEVEDEEAATETGSSTDSAEATKSSNPFKLGMELIDLSVDPEENNQEHHNSSSDTLSPEDSSAPSSPDTTFSEPEKLEQLVSSPEPVFLRPFSSAKTVIAATDVEHCWNGCGAQFKSTSAAIKHLELGTCHDKTANIPVELYRAVAKSECKHKVLDGPYIRDLAMGRDLIAKYKGNVCPFVCLGEDCDSPAFFKLHELVGHMERAKCGAEVKETMDELVEVMKMFYSE